MGVTDTITFGRLLQQHRVRAGLSQEALAERASLSADAIGMLERGARRMPYDRTIDALSIALKLDEREREAFAATARRERVRSRRSLTRLPLPMPLTPLIGRDSDLIDLRRWFAPGGPRLVTITGPGGVGKTHFALQLAHDVDELFDDVAFVNLAALQDPANIAPSILATLRRKDHEAAVSLEMLCSLVGKRRMLFVIDNMEHLLSGASSICEFLERCSKAVVLVTSREALRVRGERAFVLAPLDIEYAVELFLDRAGVEPRQSFSHDDAALTEICTRLDCLPLAIELAAARLRWEPLQTLLKATGSPLSTLTSNGRDAPARQRTMRTAINWSYQLLDTQEQVIFSICSLFPAGGTVDAVRTVAAANGSAAQDIDRLLIALAEKHLLRLTKSLHQEDRVEMLEVIREFARERFDSLEYSHVYERALTAHYVDVIECRARSRASAQASSWVEFVASEYLNIVAALKRSSQRDRPLALRLALQLPEFWDRQGLYADARYWLEALLDPLDEMIRREEPLVAWRAVTALALSCYWTADSQRSCTLQRRALRIARSWRDQNAIAKSLNNLGIALLEIGQARQAQKVLRESLALKEGRDDAWSIGSTVGNLGFALRLCGEYTEALRCHRRARNLFRSIGDTWGAIEELNFIGDIYYDRHEYRKAESFYAASLDGNTERIRASLAHSLEGLLAIAARRRRFRRVGLLAGAVARIRNETGQPVSPSAAARFDAACAAARAALGDSSFEEAAKAGAGMRLADAIEWVK